MQEHTKDKQSKYGYTQNRELSWLNFNRRVLEEADDKSVPLMERLKFVSIFSSNLDEFFMVRVGSLVDVMHVSPNETDSKTGMKPIEQLKKIYVAVPHLTEIKKKIYENVINELNEKGISDVTYKLLDPAETKFVNKYFKNNIFPVISPLIIGSHHPVPYLKNKNLYVVSLLKNKKNKPSLGIIPIPSALPEYIFLPDGARFIRTENIILKYADTLYGDYKACESTVISITRNADISFDDEKFEDSDYDFRIKVEKLLKKRNNRSIVRLEINKRISGEFISVLCSGIGVTKDVIIYDSSPLNMKYVFKLASDLNEKQFKQLFYHAYTPRWPENIIKNVSIIEQIKMKDKLLFYPFDSVEPFLLLLNEAAERSDVVSIKITIYRLASSSKIAHILCKAAENGKEVIVFMELRARFDEANNVEWSKLLEDAGCQVEYGVEKFKCHSKICLITLKNKSGVSHITQIGTGNYNEKTNAMYTDLSLMTASEDIGNDGELFFKNMLINNLDGDYSRLLVSPFGIKNNILKMIDDEIAKGSDGYVFVKANSVTEREVIDKLKEASCAGVRVELIIRGICCIIPEIKGITENIHITSIVGRFLEHARIYAFGKGEDAKYYISSADLMTRNLNRRIEIACPVYDREIIDEIKQIIKTQLDDNVKASNVTSDGSYKRKIIENNIGVDSQQVFIEQSMHKEAPKYGKSKFGAGKVFSALFLKIKSLFEN